MFKMSALGLQTAHINYLVLVVNCYINDVLHQQDMIAESVVGPVHLGSFTYYVTKISHFGPTRTKYNAI